MTFNHFLSPDEIAKKQKAMQAQKTTQKQTPEQIEAIYTNGQNVLVSASAGSGKTFVMVERIMAILRCGISLDRLFISTFTVKAAGELKERLETEIRKAIASETSQECRLFFNQALADLPLADIGTMDAFTQKLVMHYGYTMGISPNFRIMTDESERNLLKTDVFDDLFADYMHGKERETFIRLVKNFAGNSKSTAPFREVVEACYQFSQATENPAYWLDEIFLKGARTQTDYSVFSDEYIADFLSCLHDTADRLQDVTDLPDYPQQKKSGDPTKSYETDLAIIDRLHDEALHFDRRYGRDGLGRLATELSTLIPQTETKTVKGIKYPVYGSLHAYLKELQTLETTFTYQSETLPILLLLQAFVGDFSKQYLELKKQENKFEFSDIAHFAIAILEEEPHIRQLYQDKYHEVMVDEYQDTSHTQERLLNLLSNGHNRFMVGDIKQSIYRYRQADPQIFNQKFKDYQTSDSDGKLIILKENFRSQSEVLDSTNDLFRRLMDSTIGEIDYDESHTLVAGSPKQNENHPNYQTEILLYDTAEGEEQTDDTASVGDIKLVAKEIIRLHLQEKVPFDAITLLVESRNRNQLILQIFEEYHIPIVTDGGETNYLESLEIKLMLETLRVIDNPLDDYALVALLRSPMFGFDEDELARLALQERDDQIQPNLYQKLQNARQKKGKESQLISEQLLEKLEAFFMTFENWRQFAKWHSLHDLIWKIYNDRFYYDYVTTLPNAQQRQANLYALALRANDYEKTGFKGVTRFIHRINTIIAGGKDLESVRDSLPKDAVTLMTIHKSKGLQFPYVFILNIGKSFNFQELNSPFILSRETGIGISYVADMREALGETFLPAVKVKMEMLPYILNKRELHHATLSEKMRLLYVAMTRAEKKVYFVGKANADKYLDSYSGKSEANHVPAFEREKAKSFQDWLLAIQASYAKQIDSIALRFVTDADLTEDKIPAITYDTLIPADDLHANRQSDTITEALDRLETVAVLNQKYHAAINLPSVRTPSQIKKFYEPVIETDGVDVMEKLETKKIAFTLPNFGTEKKPKATEIGSAVHELLQRLPLVGKVDEALVLETISSLSTTDAVKSAIAVDKIVAFFEQTSLGQLIQKESDNLHRESPFAMLMRDKDSQEEFVVRGIIDGYLLFEDRIILFDYKTDTYKDSQTIKNRYKDQMTLYAQALRRSYGIERVDCHLVLLGGDDVTVIRI